MPSIGIKFLLVLTSLCPVAIAEGIVFYNQTKNITVLLVCIIISAILIVVCDRLMHFMSRPRPQHITLFVEELNRRDQNIIVFLFVYLFPFLRSPIPLFSTDLFVTGYILFIVFLSMVDIGAYSFNPIIRLIGYRSYVVKDRNSIQCLLIVRQNLSTSKIKIPVNEICTGVLIARRNVDVRQLAHSDHYKEEA